MFKSGLGSPRLSNQEQNELSILSPRNFLKMIADSIDDFRNSLSSPNQHNYQAFVSTFDPYLSTFSEEFKKYSEAKVRKQKPNRHQELQLQLKINRIPSIFFTDCDKYQLQLGRRSEAKKRQEELSEYLDQIELALFIKAGKYPEKSTLILENMNSLKTEADNSLRKVIEFREHIKLNIVKASRKQLFIKSINSKIGRIEKVIEYAETMRKMKNLKHFSCAAYDDSQSHQEILLKVKKVDLQNGNHFSCLETIIKNVEGYRTAMKEKLYKEFLSEIEHIVNTLLKYNKEDWKNINVPDFIFGSLNNPNISHNNITILDQSYFAFESHQVNIITHTHQLQQSPIKEEEEDSNHQILDLTKICKLWTLIRQFDLYDEEEVDQHFTKVMIRHNVAFNRDMEEYISYLQQSQNKGERQSSNILKGPQTYASLKGKLSPKEQKLKESREISSQTAIQLAQEKIAAVEMKLYLKIVKFEYSLIKKVLCFLNDYRELQFLMNFKMKLAEVLEGIISFFSNAKKITHQLTVEDFLTYLEILHFWENQEFYEVIAFCENLKNNKIEQYLTNVQKILLIKELKGAIENSNYLPVNVSSSHYMTFHYLISPNTVPHFEDDVNMSVTFQLDDLPEEGKKEVTLRLINKNIIYNDKTYMVCDSFLELVKNVERYQRLKDSLPDFQQNIQEKMCELIGFYAWYNQKNLVNSKAGAKTLKNYCTFYSTILLLKQILSNLEITNKKIEKTKVQLNDCETQISKSITMTPFMTVQYQISQLYESKMSPKTPVPTAASQRIIDVLRISFDCLREYFPLEYEEKLHQSLMVKFMQNTIKLIFKNYFGYLSNMEKRGLAEIAWFLPKFREVTDITIVRDNNLVNKKGELLMTSGSSTVCIFHEEVEEMERTFKLKSIEK